MCSTCHAASNREYRGRRAAERTEIQGLRDFIEELRGRVALLEDENIRLLGRLVAKEAIVAAFVSRGTPRGMGDATQAEARGSTERAA